MEAILSFLKDMLSNSQGSPGNRGIVVETVALEEDEELGKLSWSKNNARPLPGEPFMVPVAEEGSGCHRYETVDNDTSCEGVPTEGGM